jgi:hypothetical protein
MNGAPEFGFVIYHWHFDGTNLDGSCDTTERGWGAALQASLSWFAARHLVRRVFGWSTIAFHSRAQYGKITKATKTESPTEANEENEDLPIDKPPA